MYLARLWWRGAREPRYRHALRARLGYYRAPVPPGAVWIHAVSLGETRAAAPLIAALRAAQPGVRFLLTHGTATGWQAGTSLLRPGDQQTWLPYDTPGAVLRFFNQFRPCVGVLMETEVWPALLMEAQRRELPMVLANARLSEKSAARGHRLRALMRPAAAAFHAVLAQSEADAQRLLAAGAPTADVFGNLKYDIEPPPEQLRRGRAWHAAIGRPVVIAANTRPPEEGTLLAAWWTWPAPRPLLLIVPRHPQRFKQVADAVRSAGFTRLSRSAWQGDAAPAELLQKVDVLLGDSIGEMASYYAAADLGLLGGSFAPLGGHNLIEAAACGCPLLIGPSTYNFAEAAERALEAGAALRVADLRAAVAKARALLGSAELPGMATKAIDYAATYRGAAPRSAACVLALLARRESS